jgi:hypothetical protein
MKKFACESPRASARSEGSSVLRPVEGAVLPGGPTRIAGRCSRVGRDEELLTYRYELLDLADAIRRDLVTVVVVTLVA